MKVRGEDSRRFAPGGVRPGRRTNQSPPLRVRCWSEADAALAELGRTEQELDSIEQRRQLVVARAELEARRASRPLERKRARLLSALARFCRRHQAELVRANGHSRRSRALLFGRLGFRTSQAVLVGEEAAALRALAHWPAGEQFLRVRTELDRESLRNFLLSAAGRSVPIRRRLGRAGIRLQRRQNWFYEIDTQAVERWGDAA